MIYIIFIFFILVLVGIIILQGMDNGNYNNYNTTNLIKSNEKTDDNDGDIINSDSNKTNKKGGLLDTRTYRKKKMNEFDLELSSIPEEEICIGTRKKNSKKLLKEMNEYKFTNIRKNTKYENFDKYIVLDTETTGLYPATHELLEISMVKFENHKPVSCMTTLIKPNKLIPQKITDINSIDNELVQDSPKVSQVIDSFNEYLKGYDIVGYNLSFDMKFLYVNGIDFFSEDRKFYDVLDFARKKINKSDIYDYKLDTVAEYYDIYRDNSHRALSDAYATGLVFENLLNETIDQDVIYNYKTEKNKNITNNIEDGSFSLFEDIPENK